MQCYDNTHAKTRVRTFLSVCFPITTLLVKNILRRVTYAKLARSEVLASGQITLAYSSAHRHRAHRPPHHPPPTSRPFFVIQPHIMNPDAVVALAATTFGNTSSAKACELRSSTSELTNGLHPDLNHRTVPVLDALAAICVKKGQHDAAAVALKLKLPKIELFLATNDKTPKQETVEHLKDVWRILEELSHLHFHGVDEKKKVDLREDSPPLQLPTKEQQSLANKLHCLVYKHSYPKLCKRHEKYWKVIRRFWGLLKDKNSKNKEDVMDEEEQLLQEQMRRLIAGLKFYRRLLGEYHDVDWDVDDIQLSKFTSLLEGILHLADSLLTGSDACERWMDELKCEPKH